MVFRFQSENRSSSIPACPIRECINFVKINMGTVYTAHTHTISRMRIMKPKAICECKIWMHFWIVRMAGELNALPTQFDCRSTEWKRMPYALFTILNSVLSRVLKFGYHFDLMPKQASPNHFQHRSFESFKRCIWIRTQNIIRSCQISYNNNSPISIHPSFDIVCALSNCVLLR